MSEFIFIGLAHTLFVVIFTFSKKTRQPSDNILIAWIIFLAMPLLTRALSPALLDISVPLIDKKLAYPLCWGPFLWLYVKSVTGDIEKFKLSHLWHFMPFLLVTLYQVIFRDPPGLAGNNNTDILNIYFSRIIWFANIMSLFCYSGVVIRRLQQHSQEVLKNFSSLTNQITLRWLIWLTCTFIIAYMLPLIARLASLPLPFQSHGYALTGFIFILSFFGLKQTNVFTNKNHFERGEIEPNNREEVSKIESEACKREKPNNPKKEKYERSGLTQERSLLLLKRLEEYTINEKPYLDANLTVDKLANQSHIPRHYLTQIFSEQLNKNFYLYINEYRISKVKQLLNDPANKNMTLIEVAYKSGFNSKSTFNTIFKKVTNMTPSQYKKNNSSC